MVCLLSVLTADPIKLFQEAAEDESRHDAEVMQYGDSFSEPCVFESTLCTPNPIGEQNGRDEKSRVYFRLDTNIG